MGEKKAAETFFIDLSAASNIDNKVWKEKAQTFTTFIVNAYQKRVAERNPKFLEKFAYLEPVFRLVDKKWKEVPALVNAIGQLIQNLKSVDKDQEGLLLLESSDINPILTKLLNNHKHWEKIPVLNEFVETLLHSRQAKLVLVRWIIKFSRARTRKERIKNRLNLAKKLLQISASAIYLPFVWRTLMKYDQLALTPFLQPKAFRGVFYLEPNARPEIKEVEMPKPARVRAPRRAKVRTTRGARARKGRLPIRKGRSNWGSSGEGTGSREQEVKGLEIVKREKELEKIMEDEIKEKRDHADLFCLPGTFGLVKLLPQQVQYISQQLKNQLLNGDRSLPFRTKAAIRWTLLPTTNFAEIVELIEKNPNLPVNVVEALIRGLVYGDEPCAPLPFLFSTKFLTSDRSRVAVYSIRKMVKWMNADDLIQSISFILKTDRRKQLKVTAYKEIIRLLASKPTDKSIETILTEWKRKSLHRDIRITVLQSVLSILKTDATNCWKILETAVAVPNSEVQIALLGASPATGKKTEVDTGIVTQPRIMDHLKRMTGARIPQNHCARYARNIVLRLVESGHDDNVKAIAITALFNWKGFGIQNETADILFKLVTNMTPEFLNNPRTDLQRVYRKRWEKAATHLVGLCGISMKEGGCTIPKKMMVDVLNVLTDKIKTVAIREREIRTILIYYVNFILRAIPDNGVGRKFFTKEEEESFFVPLQKLNFMFDSWLLTRQVRQFSLELPDPENQFFLLTTKILSAALVDVGSSLNLFDTLLSVVSSDKALMLKIVRSLIFDQVNQLHVSQSKQFDLFFREIQTKAMNYSPSIFGEADLDIAFHFVNLLHTDIQKELFWDYESKFSALNSLVSTIVNQNLNSDKIRVFLGNLIDKVMQGTSSLAEKRVLLNLLSQRLDIFINHFSARICSLLYFYLDQLSRNVAEFTENTFRSLVLGVSGSIESETINAEMRKKNQYSDSLIHFIEAFVTCSLQVADPIPLWRSHPFLPLANKIESRPVSPQQAHLFFKYSLELLNKYTSFVEHRTDTFLAFAHEMVCYTMWRPKESKVSSIQTLLSVLDREEKQLVILKHLLSLPFVSGSKKPLPAYGNALWVYQPSQVDPSMYRYFNYNLVFNLISVFGVTTEKPKEGSTFARQIFKPAFEDILDQLCQDSNPKIRNEALNLALTKSVRVISDDF